MTSKHDQFISDTNTDYLNARIAELEAALRGFVAHTTLHPNETIHPTSQLQTDGLRVLAAADAAKEQR